MANVVEEYLYALKPVVDKKTWDSATNTIQGYLKQAYAGVDFKKERQEKREALKQFFKDYADAWVNDDTETLKRLGAGAALASVNGLKNVGNIITNLTDVFSDTLDHAQKLLDKASDISNEFVTGSSIFVNEDVKEKMLTFGIGTTQAQTIVAAEEALGISAEDYGLLTAGQRKAFDELMNYYQEGLNSLDPKKLEAFNNTMQEFQLSVQKFKMDAKIEIMRLFSESDTFKDLVNTFQGFLKDVINILSSDTARFVFDTFVSFLKNIIEILSVPLKLFGGGGSTTTHNTTNNYNNTTNNYGSISTSGTNPLYIQQARNPL